MKMIQYPVHALCLMICLAVVMVTHAQLKGDHLLGDYGLDAGTQAPPSIVGAVPLYWYKASKLIDDDGNVLTSGIDMNVFLVGAGGSIVTNLKILDANYGASLLFCFMSDRIEGNRFNTTSALGFSDTYVQPLQLGWHWKHADLTAGYAVYIPTGKYEYGSAVNKGMGMWTHEFSAGTTISLDPKKSFSFSSIAFFETHSKKRDVDARTGNIITLEGGVRKAFYKKIAGFPIPVVFNAGPVYYMQFKVSKDRIPLGSTIFTGQKDRIYSWGLEANMLHPKWRTTVSLRWFDEVGAKNRFEGNTFLITLGYIIRSLAKHAVKQP